MTRRRTLRRLDAREADTLKALCDFLDVQQAQGKLLYIRHNPSTVISKVVRGKIKTAFKKVRESQLGTPDVIVFPGPINPVTAAIGDCDIDGFRRPIAIEAKSPTGKQSDEQKKWQKMAEKTGMRYIIARSLEDAINALK